MSVGLGNYIYMTVPDYLKGMKVLPSAMIMRV